MSGTRRAAMLEEARAARARGDLDLAVRRCEAVLAEAPDDLEAVYLLGAIQAQRGADEAALRCFERVLEREPCRAEAWNARGVLLERHGALAEAEH
ncbi:MAG TPA: tetratricopeptide repeat protein, partial [Chromatiales bacterium]|nr:tetratricopeptide repeat protein [Chromatiales bacterium]